MTLKFYEIWDELVENSLGGDDSAIGETIFEEYNAMNPKNKLIWEVLGDENHNSMLV